MSDDQIWKAALHVAKTGMSANEGLRQLRQAFLGIRREDWLATVRAAREHLASAAGAVDRPGGMRPLVRDIFIMTTVIETGFMQHVDIWVKSRETGEVYPRPFSIRTDDLMTHDDAIATALDQFESHADFYGEVILGAAYRSTYQLVPKAA